MIFNTNQNVKHHIVNVLQRDVFYNINKVRKNFIISVLWQILSIKGRINFLQLGRCSTKMRKLSETAIGA